jgi:hypothetical protein
MKKNILKNFLTNVMPVSIIKPNKYKTVLIGSSKAGAEITENLSEAERQNGNTA